VSIDARAVLAVMTIQLAWGAASLAHAAPDPVQAAYPSKPVRIVVGFPPGGGNDLIARLVGASLQDDWGQAVVIDNKTGADGIIATEFVARAVADGYTLLIGATGHMTAIPALRASLPYDTLRDFAAVAMIGSFPLVLAVNPAIEAQTVKAFVDLAKASPGKLNYGAGASAFELATELFKMRAGVDIHHIPYKGGAQAINAVLANDVQMTMVDSAPVIPHLRAGRLRALAVTSAIRASTMPDVPTMLESGFPDFEVMLWTGLFAPAATPSAVIDRLRRDLASVLRSEQVRERFASLGIQPAGPSSAEFTALIRAELARWSAVAKAAKLGVD
jgi:tripartite-type tricarboxylate transporter receptor subunit TctC